MHVKATFYKVYVNNFANTPIVRQSLSDKFVA